MFIADLMNWLYTENKYAYCANKRNHAQRQNHTFVWKTGNSVERPVTPIFFFYFCTRSTKYVSF